eukprot:CAMPEP_0168521246 /NCGR_PEP_ID=MMETSP0405-20121227/8542_1 /TAXON_ID=498012 /ORGANISM="Trichosphaerium sp, Strain Am-I-7 wt" /LENGTH=101 /DNA_ID=CAMNT_0008542429 /DNA_START=406 /DNA_END=711 /DNA_ORIENTATION=+
MTLMFGLRFPSAYFPWVLMGMRLLMSGSLPIAELLGVLTGHLYYYMQDVIPATQGRPPILVTPNFIKKWFNEPIGGQHPGPQGGPRTPGYNWGGGNRLGGQ